MLKNNRTVLALHTDTHAGNSLGLFNPECVYEEENEKGEKQLIKHELGAWQTYLWGLYTEHVGEVFKIAGNSPLYVAHLGDMTQGIRFLENLCATSIHGQVQIAISNTAPWFKEKKKPVSYIQTYGTGVHVLGEGSSERLSISFLREKYPNVEFVSMYHALLDFRGAQIDLAHHGSSAGSRAWLEGNTAGWEAKSQIIKDIMGGIEPPHLIARGHVHEYRRNVQVAYTADDKEYVVHTIIVPSYCGMGDHGYKATRSAHLVQNGMVVVVFENSKIVDIIPLVKTVDIRSRKVIE